MAKAPLIVIAAGGTGGHMFPAQALSEALLQDGWRVKLSTDERGARYTSGFPKAVEIEQVASAVNELSSTADNVSDNALAADQTAQTTNELAKSGLDIFAQSTDASDKMAIALTDAAVVVNRLWRIV